jgi:hypothetical protein
MAVLSWLVDHRNLERDALPIASKSGPGGDETNKPPQKWSSNARTAGEAAELQPWQLKYMTKEEKKSPPHATEERTNVVQPGRK